LHALVAQFEEVVAGKDVLIAELSAANTKLGAQVVKLVARVEELERRLGRDSSNSSKPPSSDDPFVKRTKSKDRSLREKTGRKPGKQLGESGSGLPLVENPDEVIVIDPLVCPDCCTSLVQERVTKTTRRQVIDVKPPPPPGVTEYQLITRFCRGCAKPVTGQAPVAVTNHTQYGPVLRARAAVLLCAHYLPVNRASQVLASLSGVKVSTGFLAGIRAQAARLVEKEFLPHVRRLLRQAPVLHVDESPGRAQGKLEYVHVASTPFLTAMHTGGRTRQDIDAGGVLVGYTGTIVRDDYAGYQHLVAAEHALCAAHLLRDLRAIHTADPLAQIWAKAMADTLSYAHHATSAAREAGDSHLAEQIQAEILARYRGAAAKGITDNTAGSGLLAGDALKLARRLNEKTALVLRFATNLDVPWTNNQAERDVRPVKIQQRSSAGCWRTLQGIADFAVVTSYLSTATKWGKKQTEVLEQLFTTGAWLPPNLQPTE
jgi:transposase